MEHITLCFISLSLSMSLFTKNNSLASPTNNSHHHEQTTELVSDDNNTLRTVTFAAECNQDSI